MKLLQLIHMLCFVTLPKGRLAISATTVVQHAPFCAGVHDGMQSIKPRLKNKNPIIKKVTNQDFSETYMELATLALIRCSFTLSLSLLRGQLQCALVAAGPSSILITVMPVS